MHTWQGAITNAVMDALAHIGGIVTFIFSTTYCKKLICSVGADPAACFALRITLQA